MESRRPRDRIHPHTCRTATWYADLPMGAPLRIFRLYRVATGSSTRHLLAKVIRPDFPNWSQTAEDDAVDEAERQFEEIVAGELNRSMNEASRAVATWEGAFPQGDCFYETLSGIELSIWYALDAVHPGYFVFGQHDNEAAFWAYVEELARDGEICPVTDYARPARLLHVRFVQSG